MIASLSGGKDSVAMLLMGDYKTAVFYDTGKEFDAIYNVINKVHHMYGCDIAFIRPNKSFDYYMFDHERVKGKNKGKKGYGWCGGNCRWGTTKKLASLDQFAKQNKEMIAIGIAADETKRIVKERADYKVMPLVDMGMTEKDCLDFCYKHGVIWLEKTASKFKVPEYINLYDILDRVSCWCCRNKNLKELKNIFKYFTYSYWAKLKEMEQRIGVKMKPKGWLHELEVIWEREILAEGGELDDKCA